MSGMLSGGTALGALSRWVKRLGTGLSSRAQVSPSLAAAGIVASIGLSWLIGIALGGAAHVAPHWFYLPIMLAAARFGPGGACLVGALAAVVAGPLLPADAAHQLAQEPSDWISRGVFFVTLGTVLGYVFKRVERALTRELALVSEERDRAREAVNALHRSEARYRQMFEQNRAIKLLICPETGAIVEANSAACAFYGYPRHELQRRSIHDLDTRSPADVANDIEQALTGEYQTFVCQHRLATGEGRDVEIHASPLAMEGRTLIYTIVHDITDRRRAEVALRESEQRYRNLVEISPDAILLADLTGTILVANAAAADLYGHNSPDALVGVNALSVTAPEDHDRIRAAIAQTAQSASRRSEIAEYRQVRRDGSTFPAETRAGVLVGEDGSPTGFLVTVRDISVRKEAEEATRQLAAIVDAASDAIVRMTPDGIVTSWNPSAEQLYGYSEAEVIGQSASIFVPPDRVQERDALFEQLQQGASIRHVETVRLRKGGQPVDVSLSISPIKDGLGNTVAYAVTAYDISERKAFEEQLKHQALHDSLTRLPNRTLLNDRLEQAILSAHRGATSMALLVMDLDRFKEVNDTLGHQAGDVLLQEVAARLAAAVRESDTVARLGGDEFAIILPSVDERRAHIVAQKIRTALRQPLILEGHRIDIEASIGVALYPAHGTDASALLRRADVAMYAAKRSGEGYRSYTPDQDLNSPVRLALVADLRAAIEEDQLLLHYQPKLNIRNGTVQHVEALVRWKHPDHGLIPPGEFISLAEDTGLIDPLTLWVLKTALGQCAQWRRAGLDLSVAVNLSVRNLRDPHLPETIAWLIRSAGVDASALIVEITESSLMDDPEGALVVLTQLHEMGVKISIDDFGTGYSSLAYLKQLPVDEIKIDRSFVLGMTRNGTVIVRSVIDLGHNLGIDVTAEGVEDEEMLDLLARMGCSMAQGFYLSRPLPAPDLTTWVVARSRERSTGTATQDTILVVDDNPVYQELIQVLLTDEGYQVATVGNAEDALSAVQEMTPDLVLTDVHLPGMSGLELVRQMRSLPHLRDTVIVAITGAPRPEDEQYALSVGCDVYTAKPNRNRDVVQLVCAHLPKSTRQEAAL